MKPLAAAVVFSLIAGSAQARSDVPALVTRWDTAVLIQAAEALEAKDVAAKRDDDGRPYVSGESADGLLFVFYPTACEAEPAAKGPARTDKPKAKPLDSPCYGMEAVVTYDTEGKSEADRSKLVDQLNRDFALGKFTIDSDQSIVLSRYLVFDDGVTRGNFEAELSNFLAVGTAAAGKIWPRDDKAD